MYWPLLGVGVLVLGFLVRLNPLAVVIAAAMIAGLTLRNDPLFVLAQFGKAFNDARYVSLIWLVVPVIGMLERAGLRQRARDLVGRVRGLSVGRFLLGYFVLRQISAALGLTALGGQAQMVRPLIAPMAEAAAENQVGVMLEPEERQRVRAHAAAVDNVAVFFGEDIFIAFGSVLLIKAALAQGGFDVTPLSISRAAIPSAVLALVIHGARLLWLDTGLRWRRS